MVIISEERIKKLEKVLANYSDILNEFGIKKYSDISQIHLHN